MGVANAQGRVILVKIWQGEALFERSEWLQSQRARGVLGWLIPNPTLWSEPDWNPDYWLSDPDVPDRPRSEAVRLAPSEAFAYGVRSAPSLLSAPQRRQMQQARWVQVDLGDVARAERYAKLCTHQQAEQLTTQAWEQVDAWCAHLTRLLAHPSDRLVVLGVPDDPDGLWALFAVGGDLRPVGLIQDPRVSLNTVAHSESLRALVQGTLPFEIAPDPKGEAFGLLAKAQAHWDRHRHSEPLRKVLLGIWLILLLAAVLPLRPKRRRPMLRVVGSARPKPPPKSRAQRTLTAYGVWAVALSVASLLPAALSASGSLPLLAVWLVGAGVLVLMVALLDNLTLGLGALAGLGLTLLMLDSLSGGNWARDGLLGYATLGEGRTIGMGDAYGALAVVWTLLFCAVWLRIEGNPLGAFYLMVGVALWLGWRAHNLPITLMAVLSALAGGFTLLRQEATQRKRLRLSLMRAGRIAVRTAPIPHERKLIPHIAVGVAMLVGALMLALWRHQPDASGYPDTVWNLIASGWGGVLVLSVIGLFLLRRLRPMVPEAVQYGWLAGLAGALLGGLIPLSIALFTAWAVLLSALQQETESPMPNPKAHTGGTK